MGSRKISYAASVGLSDIRESEKESFAKWLAGYDAISVRERQAKELLSSITCKSITQVLDPTFY